jgi:hypothetical protein
MWNAYKMYAYYTSPTYKPANYAKRVNRLIKEGDLILDREEGGYKIYKRKQDQNLKNDYFINGVLASTLSESDAAERLKGSYSAIEEDSN